MLIPSANSILYANNPHPLSSDADLILLLCIYIYIYIYIYITNIYIYIYIFGFFFSTDLLMKLKYVTCIPPAEEKEPPHQKEVLLI